MGREDAWVRTNSSLRTLRSDTGLRHLMTTRLRGSMPSPLSSPRSPPGWQLPSPLPSLPPSDADADADADADSLRSSAESTASKTSENLPAPRRRVRPNSSAVRTREGGRCGGGKDVES